MKTSISFVLPDGYRVESFVHFSNGANSIPSESDYVGEHTFGLPRDSRDCLVVRIEKL